MTSINKPEKFFSTQTHLNQHPSTITSVCIGFENGEWRCRHFSRHIFEWLLEFATDYSTLKGINPGNSLKIIRDAANRVYKTEKYQTRGEFGELILHAIIRQHFNTEPAISKLYYKSTNNETVKGFDAVHITYDPKDEQYELWLGEAKFYNNINSAINAVISELESHTKIDYLKDEFLLIKSKVDSAWDHAKNFIDLISANRSMDEIIKIVNVPILLTYDSECINNHCEVCDKYKSDFTNEIIKHYDNFSKLLKNKLGQVKFKIHLILFPLKNKAQLVKMLHEQLEKMK